MAIIADVTPSSVIQSTWGNAIRDQVVATAANAATRNAAIPGEDDGRVVYLEDIQKFTYGNGAEWCWLPGTVIARASRDSSSPSTTSETAVMRLAVGAVPQGQILRVETALLDLYSPTANDVVNARIRYTTDGSTPTTASAVMPASVIQRRLTGAGVDEMCVISTHYVPGAGENLTVLLTVGRSAGSGNAQILGSATQPIKILVTAAGTDPGDTGVDY